MRGEKTEKGLAMGGEGKEQKKEQSYKAESDETKDAKGRVERWAEEWAWRDTAERSKYSREEVVDIAEQRQSSDVSREENRNHEEDKESEPWSEEW
ncbi:hypothetical protein NDU88_005491 [Pleurodeles waltl]|uniref:Uncharacterized protein n=1 Tax=Pleurodeles waltl TaxID=8319 RepID=A0AAV7TVR5_PLEWA|nr:hypothetical protein NDU88_005491 [Pleurodeles waltl]